MQEVITIRPAELEIAPTFQGSLHETPVNVYRMKVDAQSSDERRMSFGWRAPGNNLLCSPQAYIEFDLNCQIPYTYTEPEAVSALYGMVDRSGGAALEKDAANNGGDTKIIGASNMTAAPADFSKDKVWKPTETPAGRGYRGGICFGEGDAIGNCIESIQYTINGCSISHQNWHLFKRSLDRCWVPSQVMQRIYYQSGGAWNAYDCKALTGQLGYNHAFGNAKQATTDASVITGHTCIEGLTSDSGLTKRMKNFYACVMARNNDDIKNDYPKSGTDNDARYLLSGSGFIVRVRYPLSGGLFNAVWGESGLARSCPYQRLALAIPNYNQGSLTVLFKDLMKCLVRRLGRTCSLDANRHGQLVNNSETSKDNAGAEIATARNATKGYGASTEYNYPFTVKLRSSVKPSLHLTYLRLQSFRRYPEVASFSTYRTQTYLGPTTTEAPGDCKAKPVADIFDSGTPEYIRLCPVNSQFAREIVNNDTGTCAVYNPDSAYKVGAKAVQEVSRVWTVNFQNLQFAQPPSYILIAAQKSSSCYSHQNPLIGAVKAGVDFCEMKNDYDAVETAGMCYVNATDSAEAKTGAAIANVAETYKLPDLTQRLAVYTKIAGRYVAQNQDSNLSILRLSILVQSSVGSFKFSSDKFPYLRDQAIIWNEHKRNCCTDYFKDATISDWSKRQCCVLLNVSQYLHGLGSSAGVAFPIQISADVDFANQCRFVDGIYGYDNKYYNGPMVHADPIVARPVFVGLFDKQVVQVASSSAVLSAQNLSQASATQILASRQ